jgi:hypothetical protein
MLLDLLARPEQLYRLAGKQACRVHNHPIFTRLYLDADEGGPLVAGDESTEPFAPLMHAHRAVRHNGGGAAHQGNDTPADDDHWRTTVLVSAMAGGVRVTPPRGGAAQPGGSGRSSPGSTQRDDLARKGTGCQSRVELTGPRSNTPALLYSANITVTSHDSQNRHDLLTSVTRRDHCDRQHVDPHGPPQCPSGSPSSLPAWIGVSKVSEEESAEGEHQR